MRGHATIEIRKKNIRLVLDKLRALTLQSRSRSRLNLHPDYGTNQVPSNYSPSFCIWVTAENRLIVGLRVEKRRNSNDNIGRAQQAAFKVVTPAIKYKEVDDEGADKQADGFEESEVQGHLFRHAPAEENNEWGDEER